MLIYLNRIPFLIGKFNQVADQIVRSFSRSKNSRIIFPSTLHELALSEDESAKNFYRQIDYSTCDSMLLTYFFRYKTGKKIDRVYGPELILAILDRYSKIKSSQKNLFLAPDKNTMNKMSVLLAKQYPQMHCTFAYLPKNLNKQQETAHLEKINFVGSGLVWIGIGSPKQIELASWFKTNYQKADVFCVGAAFDFLTGQKKQAPIWMQKHGLEWLFRLISEPRRLWRRYLIIIPKYLLKVIFLHKKLC